MHPLKDQREGVKYGRGVKYGVTPEFSKDGSAELEDKFTDGGSDNQPVVLQIGVGLSCCQAPQHYCQFQSNLQGLPEIGEWPLYVVVYVFFDEVKKAGGILTKFWYPGISVYTKLARRLL